MEKFISGGFIENHGNKNYRTFHLRHELVKKNKWFSSEYSIGEDEVLPLTMTTSKAILEIPGVKNLSIKPYELSIEKAEAFTWKELMPQIILAMSKYLPANYA